MHCGQYVQSMWFANTHRWRAALTSFSIYSKMLSSLSAHRHRYTCLKMRVASLAWFPGCGWHFLFACTCNPSARAYLFSSSRREQGVNRRCLNDFLNALWPIQIGTVGWNRHCRRCLLIAIVTPVSALWSILKTFNVKQQAVSVAAMSSS